MTAATQVRERLVDALCAAGRVRTPAVEEAFRAVPRHLFLPDIAVCEAYADEAVAVQHVNGVATSSASQPSMVAIMLEQLDVRPGHRVLEIGAGTGYNAALLAHLAGPTGAVTSVDIDPELVTTAAAHLAAAGISGVELHCADGALGHPPGAPYDRIVLTVGSADIRPDWVVQLAPGGRLLLPLSLRGSQVSVALDLDPDRVLRSRSVRSCAFIRLRGLAAGPETVVPLRSLGLVLQWAADAPAASPAGPGVVGVGEVEPAASALSPAGLVSSVGSVSSAGLVEPQAVAEPAVVDAALAEPGPVTSVAVAIGAADLWDGFGLFLALTTPGTCRLLLTEPEADGAGFAPMAPGIGTLGLAGPGGLAVVTAGSRHRVGVRAFGPGGPAQVEQLLAALDRWVAAGRPDAAGLLLTVRPRSDASAPRTEGGANLVTEHCRITVGWAGGAHP